MALTLASNAITFTDNTSLSSGIIGTAQLSAGAVTTSILASDAITTDKINTGAVTFDKISQNSGPFSFRNKVQNGDMRIDQRLNGGVHTVAGTTIMTMDRYFMGCTEASSAYTVQRVTDVPTGAGFVNSMKFTITDTHTMTVNNWCGVHHSIEGLNLTDLCYGTSNAKPVTLSFWVKASIPGTYSGFWRPTLSGLFKPYMFTYTIVQANTWEFKTITIPGDTQRGINLNIQVGVTLHFSLGAGPTVTTSTVNEYLPEGSNFLHVTGTVQPIQTNGATFFLTGLQLEIGTVATPFEHRSISTELALCQRYLYRLSHTSTAGSNRIVANGVANATTNLRLLVILPVNLRTIPTLSFRNVNDFDIESRDLRTVTSMNISSMHDSITHNHFELSVNGTGFITHEAVQLVMDQPGGFIQFSAEI
jgi:hypothetical protein